MVTHFPTGDSRWLETARDRSVVTLRRARSRPDIEGVQSYVTFRHLGGPAVSHEQVASEIAQWPLDGILGYLGALSLAAV